MSESPADPFAFEPVPSASSRHDGWTPERQRAFIAELARIGMVSAAAPSVGMSRKSAYELLKRAGPESGFARVWRDRAAAYRSCHETSRRIASTSSTLPRDHTLLCPARSLRAGQNDLVRRPVRPLWAGETAASGVHFVHFGR
jgi:hypothetical protein